MWPIWCHFTPMFNLILWFIVDYMKSSCSSLSATNAEYQYITKSTPDFTPKNVKSGVLFSLYPKSRTEYVKKLSNVNLLLPTIPWSRVQLFVVEQRWHHISEYARSFHRLLTLLSITYSLSITHENRSRTFIFATTHNLTKATYEESENITCPFMRNKPNKNILFFF